MMPTEMNKAPTKQSNWIGAAISAGASLLGNLFSSGMSNSAMNKQMALQREINAQNQANFEQQMQFNADEAQKNRDFQSYQSQVDQMKEAGLNPAFMFGQSGAMSQSGSAASSSGLPELQNPFNATAAANVFSSQADAFNNALKTVLDTNRLKNETSKTNKDIEAIGKEMEKKDVEIQELQQTITESQAKVTQLQELLLNMRSERWLNEKRGNNLDAQNSVFGSQKNFYDAETYRSIADTDYINNKIFNEAKITDATVKKYASEYHMNMAMVSQCARQCEYLAQKVLTEGTVQALNNKYIEIGDTTIRLNNAQAGTLEFNLDFDKKNKQDMLTWQKWQMGIGMFNQTISTVVDGVATFMTGGASKIAQGIGQSTIQLNKSKASWLDSQVPANPEPPQFNPLFY